MLELDPPNRDLYSLNGRLVVQPKDGTSRSEDIVKPVSMQEVLLRGCMLKNSGWGTGFQLVVIPCLVCWRGKRPCTVVDPGTAESVVNHPCNHPETLVFWAYQFQQY